MCKGEKQEREVSTRMFYLWKYRKCVLIRAFEDVPAFFVDHLIGMSLDL